MKFLSYVFILILPNYTLSIAMKKDMPINQKEDLIPPTEDLMREHGLLNRVLLIYEEIIRRIEQTDDFQVQALGQSIAIIKEFIEAYHEELEEQYIFPLFKNDKKGAKLTETLKNQHNKGRDVTNEVKALIEKPPYTTATKKKIASLLKKFIRMYRPHEAREDTIVFPQVRSLISEQEFKELGEKFEDLEHQLFGPNGFESIVKRVESIEKGLGIYQLEQFTPKIGKSE